MPLGEPGYLFMFDPVGEMLAQLTHVQPGTTWCRTEHRGDGTGRLHVTILSAEKEPGDTRVLLLDGPRAGETATLREVEEESSYRIVQTITYHHVPDDQLDRAFRHVS